MLDVAKSELEHRISADLFQVSPAAVGRHDWKFPFDAISYACAAIDAVIIISSSLLGGLFYQALSTSVINNFDAFLGAGVLAALLYVLTANSAGLYRFTSIVSKQKTYLRILNSWILVGLSLSLLAFLFKVGASFSRGSAISFLFLTLVFLLGFRKVVTQILSHAVEEGYVQGRRVVLIGSHGEFSALDADRLLPSFGLTEIERFTLPNEPHDSLSLTDGEKVTLDRALDSARLKAADEIVFALSWSDSRRLELVRQKMRSSPLPVRILPDRVVRSLTENPTFKLQPFLSIELQRAPLSRFEQLTKRALDIAGALIAMILLLPIMAITAIVIKLDSPGPVLFRQRRNGFNANQFVIFKFRTMTVAEDGPNIVQASRFDKRITRAGRFLRESSLDELPQLLNVLRGDMSLVGPRPHALAHDSQYSKLLSEYAFRHHMKPGISGWAQVNGCRGETALIEQMQHRVEFDLWYINNWNLALDLKILIKTCFEVVRARNAH